MSCCSSKPSWIASLQLVLTHSQYEGNWNKPGPCSWYSSGKNVWRSHMATDVRLLTFKATGSMILSFFIYSVVAADGRKHGSRQHEFPETETGRRREEVFTSGNISTKIPKCAMHRQPFTGGPFIAFWSQYLCFAASLVPQWAKSLFNWTKSVGRMKSSVPKHNT